MNVVECLDFEFVTTHAEFTSLGPEWIRLAREHATDLQLFQGFVWNHTWWEHFGDQKTLDLRILIARKGGELVLVWPLMRRRRGPVHVLEQIGGLLSPYEDVLVCGGPDRDFWVREAWQRIVARRDIDALRLRGVHESSVLANTIAEFAGPPISETNAPFIDCAAVPDFQTYLAQRAKKVRNELRRSRRMLEAIGSVQSVELDATHESVTSSVEQMFEFKRAWLKARGLSGKTVMTDRGRAFVTDVCTRLTDADAHGRSCVSTLSVDGRNVAIGVGIEFKGRHYEYLDAFDFEVERCGPGRVRLAEGIRSCIERDLARYDLLTPATWFKTIWTGEIPVVRQYAYAKSVRGRMFRDLYLRAARPLMKRGYNSILRRLKRKSG